MTYADAYNIRTTSVKFNDIADALDGLITRNVIGSTTGVADTYIATPNPPWDEYKAGSFLSIVPHATNTGASTINVSGLGARAIKRSGVNVTAGALTENVPTLLIDNGTHFEILVIENAIKQDGSNSPVANLPMGGFKHTGVSTSTSGLALDGYAPITHVQNGTYINLGTAGGTANAMTATANPAITSYVAGQTFRIKTSAASNGTGITSHTLNINSIGAKSIIEQDGTDPQAGTWGSGVILELYYDGTSFVKLNETSIWQDWTPTLTLGGGSASSISYGTCRYVKIGRVVTLTFSATFTVSAATSVHGYANISGIPVSIASGMPNSVAYMTSNSIKVIGEVRRNSALVLRHYLDPAVSQVWTNGAGASSFIITYEAGY